MGSNQNITTNRMTENVYPQKSNGRKRQKEVGANLHVLQSAQVFGTFHPQSEAQTVVRWRVLR